MRIVSLSLVTRVLILTLLPGGILLQGSTLGYGFIGTATGAFGGVTLSGWYSADQTTSNITVNNPQVVGGYTFSGPLNGAGYVTASLIVVPCILLPCPGPGSAGIHLNPDSGNTITSLLFEDTGELFSGFAPLVAGDILNNLQGGPSSAPTSLNSPGLVAEITGSLTAEATQDYYDFQWLSGAFSVTASVPDATSGASYGFSVGAAGTCGSEEGSATLDSADSFTGTIAVANLAAGQYCIGIDTTSTMDPAFALIFNTPVSSSSSAPSGVPEPSGFVSLSIGLLVISCRLLARRSGPN